MSDAFARVAEIRQHYGDEGLMLASCDDLARVLDDLAAARARIEELEAALAPRERSMTHSANCWRWHRHHGCAIRRVEELEAALRDIADPGLWEETANGDLVWRGADFTPDERARAALGERDG